MWNFQEQNNAFRNTDFQFRFCWNIVQIKLSCKYWRYYFSYTMNIILCRKSDQHSCHIFLAQNNCNWWLFVLWTDYHGKRNVLFMSNIWVLCFKGGMLRVRAFQKCMASEAGQSPSFLSIWKNILILSLNRWLSMCLVVLSERALYVFECGFHPLFSLTLGNCRLDYRQAENRYAEWSSLSMMDYV